MGKKMNSRRCDRRRPGVRRTETLPKLVTWVQPQSQRILTGPAPAVSGILCYNLFAEQGQLLELHFARRRTSRVSCKPLKKLGT